MAEGTTIHWFRKGLRIHDNPALLAAIEKIDGIHYELRPVFVLDPWIVKKLRVGPNRWRFLQQALTDLDNNLHSIGSRLYVLRGKPEEVFPRVFLEWRVRKLTFESDTEPYALERDASVEKLARSAGVSVVQKVSHTLYNPESVIRANLGKPPLTYQKMLSVLDSLGPPVCPVATPKDLPQACLPSRCAPGDNTLVVPTLEELGVEEGQLAPCLFPGGETHALQRMRNCLKNKAWVCKFEKPNTSPNSLEPSTTVLSPYLKFGCLSTRTLYHQLKQTIGNASHSKPPVSLIGQLMWREFYYVVAAGTPNFDKMVGNPVCCQVPWDTNPKYLEAWTKGQTGYPFIDSIMTQLRQEGWIHHLARHAVACFLTRGDLWISWEEGQQVRHVEATVQDKEQLGLSPA
uniref:Photolyase/cryptochrome alpha/beta domain-containing protein n=1 Tax=Timema douglasi TaxID=61478 RepID=A0A7R8VD46_TIMDO|nr:unnamed protein product [Timema douglasi]